MSITKETTARNPSVGADGGQSSKTYMFSIAETEDEFNENFDESQEFFRKFQRTEEPDGPADEISSEPYNDARRCDDKIPPSKTSSQPSRIVAEGSTRFVGKTIRLEKSGSGTECGKDDFSFLSSKKH